MVTFLPFYRPGSAILETDMGITGLAPGRAAIRRPGAQEGAEPADGRRAFLDPRRGRARAGTSDRRAIPIAGEAGYLGRNQAVYIRITETTKDEARTRESFDAYGMVSLIEHRWGTFAQPMRPTEP